MTSRIPVDPIQRTPDLRAGSAACRLCQNDAMNLTLCLGALLLVTLVCVIYRLRHPNPGDTGRRIISDVFAGAAIYAFLAPLAGGIAVTLGLAIVTWDANSLMLALLGAPWFYLFGLVPALMCGAAAGALKPAVPSWRAWGKMTAIGGLYGFSLFLAFSRWEMSWTEFIFPLFVGALPGAIGSAICARLYYGKPGSHPSAANETQQA